MIKNDFLEQEKALEALIIDNPELEKLEAITTRFNIFEAIGAVRQELRHSDFLAFLLDPKQNHGLGDVFARRLIQKALQKSSSSVSVTPIYLDVWDLRQLIVLREWRHIDILLLDEVHNMVVIIENKIDSSEHSNQLKRYIQTIEQNYSNFYVVPIFLTPGGDDPSDDRYIPIDYSVIYNIVSHLTESYRSTLGPDVVTLMEHYVQLLQRYVMDDSDIAKLCHQIYRKHQLALDLIFEHKPDQQAELRTIIETMLAETPNVILDNCTKTLIRFVPKQWDIPELKSDRKDWSVEGRLFLFEFVNSTSRLHFKLTLGPGPDDVRQSLFDMAVSNQPPFKVKGGKGENWKSVFSKNVLKPADYEGTDIEDLELKIRKFWLKFLENKLPKFTTVFQKEYNL